MPEANYTVHLLVFNMQRPYYFSVKYTIDDILTPLAITVLIDHKVRQPEKTMFLEQAQGLLELFNMPMMSRDALVKWFNDNADDLNDKLEGRGKNTLILKTLTRFKEDSELESIYDAMVAISVCDREFVVEESELIKSAASLWGFQRPPIKVKR